MSHSLSTIRIVLVNTFHPGNIGAVARAMKTMGLSELYLVDPCQFPDDEASSRSAGAKAILDSATVVESLQQATADCTQVFATTARQKHRFTRPQRTAEAAADWIKNNPKEKVAIVFGRERSGLSSDEIALCQQVLYIPGNPEYSVLNIASAAQIICYELFKALSDAPLIENMKQPVLAPQKDLEGFYHQLLSDLTSTGYLRPEQPSDTMSKIRQLFNRAEPRPNEVSMLRGILKSLVGHRKKH